MKARFLRLSTWLLAGAGFRLAAADAATITGENPTDHLPPHINNSPSA